MRRAFRFRRAAHGALRFNIGDKSLHPFFECRHASFPLHHVFNLIVGIGLAGAEHGAFPQHVRHFDVAVGALPERTLIGVAFVLPDDAACRKDFCTVLPPWSCNNVIRLEIAQRDTPYVFSISAKATAAILYLLAETAEWNASFSCK